MEHQKWTLVFWSRHQLKFACFQARVARGQKVGHVRPPNLLQNKDHEPKWRAQLKKKLIKDVHGNKQTGEKGRKGKKKTTSTRASCGKTLTNCRAGFFEIVAVKRTRGSKPARGTNCAMVNVGTITGQDLYHSVVRGGFPTENVISCRSRALTNRPLFQFAPTKQTDFFVTF